MRRLLRDPDMRIWLAVVGAATLVLGAAYAMNLQSVRRSADDLPFAVSQAAKAQISKGAAPESVVPNANVNIRQNNNPFIIVTDDKAQLLAGSAFLDDRVPLPPKGVFDYTKAKGIDVVTWEPASGVRLATVVTTYKTPSNVEGFIITGQSLRQAAYRIKTSTLIISAAWLAVVAWTTLVVLLPRAGKK
jgi:hypothetical protein